MRPSTGWPRCWPATKTRGSSRAVLSSSPRRTLAGGSAGAAARGGRAPRGRVHRPAGGRANPRPRHAVHCHRAQKQFRHAGVDGDEVGAGGPARAGRARAPARHQRPGLEASGPWAGLPLQSRLSENISGQDYLGTPLALYTPKKAGAEVAVAERLARWRELKAKLQRAAPDGVRPERAPRTGSTGGAKTP